MSQPLDPRSHCGAGESELQVVGNLLKRQWSWGKKKGMGDLGKRRRMWNSFRDSVFPGGGLRGPAIREGGRTLD